MYRRPESSVWTARDQIPKRCWNLTVSPGPRAGASEPGPTWSVTTGLRLHRFRHARASTIVTASRVLVTWMGHNPPLIHISQSQLFKP